jgi:cell division protein FtsA
MTPTPRAPDVFAGLDVGTSAIKVVVARRRAGMEPSVIGMGRAPAAGVRRGVVVQLDEAADALARAIADAELTAGVSLPAVDLALSGAHLRGANSRAIVAAAGPERRITAGDASRAIDAARAVSLPDERAVVEAIPQEFVVDGQDGVNDPAGLAGTRLEVNLHLVTGSIAAILNLSECVGRCGVSIRAVAVGPLAAAHAVLSADEMALGAAVVDIGAGTTSVAVFERGALCHTAVLPVGGDHFTEDLAVGLRTPLAEAERLKRRIGRTFALSLDDDEILCVPPIAGSYDREVPRKLVPEILAGAAHALLDQVAGELRAAGFSGALPAGVVLTGGGSALGGLADTAEAILRQPVRQASPQASGCVADLVNTSSFATAIGLVLRASRAFDGAGPPTPGGGSTRRARLAGRLRSVARWLD